MQFHFLHNKNELHLNVSSDSLIEPYTTNEEDVLLGSLESMRCLH